MYSSAVDCDSDTLTQHPTLTLAPYYHMIYFLDAIEGHLNITSNTTIHKSVSEDTLNDAGEMFIYLLTCSKPKLGWIQFYKDLLGNSSPKMIILELNRILHSNKLSENSQVEKQVLDLVTRKLNLSYSNLNSLNGSWNKDGKIHFIIMFSMKSFRCDETPSIKQSSSSHY